jgi:ribosomal 30S subunit maturation factor RimM
MSGDLVGLKLVLGGKCVARISGVFDGSSDPCLEASMPKGRVVLIPFRKEFVGEVDLQAGIVELLAPWLLEE